MTTFIALYRGCTLNDARLVALSSDLELVGDFIIRLLSKPPQENDPALREIARGRQRALKAIQKENQGAGDETK